MYVFFSVTLRVSGLASIVEALKFSKISMGAEPSRLKPLSPPPPGYSMPMQQITAAFLLKIQY